MQLVRFNPDQHKGLPLYELRTVQVGDIQASVPVLSDVPYEEARLVPFYFYVDISEAETKDADLLTQPG